MPTAHRSGQLCARFWLGVVSPGRRLELRFVVTLLTAINSALASTAEQDLTNERLYTPPAAMERHWQVDCASLATRISVALSEAPTASKALDGLLPELHKCAMIHNAPGSATQSSCPDYASSYQLLQQWPATEPAASAAASPQAVQQQIERLLHCP
jgi:hypothetical protein